jgi:hypothetical protein
VRNETAASGCTPEAAHESPPTTPSSMTEGTPRRKSTRPRPLVCDTLAEIERSEKTRVRLELVTWNEVEAPVVGLVLLVLGRSGAWFPAKRFTLRLDECERVAAALRMVSA